MHGTRYLLKSLHRHFTRYLSKDDCHSLSSPFNTKIVLVFFCLDYVLLCRCFMYFLFNIIFSVLSCVVYSGVLLCIFVCLRQYKLLSGSSVVDFE